MRFSLLFGNSIAGKRGDKQDDERIPPSHTHTTIPNVCVRTVKRKTTI